MQILLIEDDSMDVVTFSQMADHAYAYFPKLHVTVCKSILQAKEVLSQGGTDLIVLDLYLSDSDGLSGFKELVTLFPEIALVIHSVVYNPELASKAIELGAQDYIVKGTMERDELLRTIVHAKLRHDLVWKLRKLNIEQ